LSCIGLGLVSGPDCLPGANCQTYWFNLTKHGCLLDPAFGDNRSLDEAPDSRMPMER
jgi:hypothetical protein